MMSAYICYHCLSENTSGIGVLPDFDHDIFRCNACGLVQSEFLSDKYLEGFYEKKYREARKEKINENYIAFMKKRAFSQKAFIRNNCTIPGDCKIIDIGAGAGELLLSFREECGHLYALEYDAEMKKHLCRTTDIHVIDDDDLAAGKYRNFFNLVFMSHVFEHLNDPEEYLQKVHKSMCEDGHLFIEVPNETTEVVKSHVRHQREGLGHLFFYNMKTIKKIVTVSRLFEIVSIDTCGISVTDYLNGSSDYDSFEKNPDGIYLRCLLKKKKGYPEHKDRSRYYRHSCENKDHRLQQYLEKIRNIKRLEAENISLREETLRLRASCSFRLGHLVLSPLKYLKRVLSESIFVKDSVSHRAHDTLQGLVIMDRTGPPVFGMNRSILLAEKHLRTHGIRLNYISSSSPHRFLLSVCKILFKTGRFRFDFALFNSAASLYYVNIHGIYTSFALPIFRLLKASKMPMYIYWHETEWAFNRLKAENPFGFDIMNKMASDPDVIHLSVSGACSRNLKRRYPDVAPINVHNCTHIPEDDNVERPPSDIPRVVNIASVQERKGTDLFVRTAIEVCKKHPEVEFVWIGGGKHYGTWDEDIRAAGLQRRILFPGYIKDPHRILRSASVFFLSSRDDPFPLTVLEAMCLGKKIITFDVGGAPEALGGHGILVRPFDTEAAAAEILNLLNRPPEKSKSQRISERYYRLYTPEIFAARLNGIIRKRLKPIR